MQRLLRDRITLIISGLTLLVTVLVATNLAPWLRGPVFASGDWAWRLIAPPDVILPRLALPILVMLLIGGWALWTTHREPVGLWRLLILVVLTVALRLAVQAVNADGVQIVSRMLNPAYFGYFQPATEIGNAADFVRTYADPDGFAALAYRQQTHPPGSTLFYWLILQAVNGVPLITRLAMPVLEPRLAGLPDWASAYSAAQITAGVIASLVVPLLGALTILPLYGLGRRLSGERAGRLAAIMYAVAPAPILFTPVIDEVYALLAALAVYLLARGLTVPNRWLIGLAGLFVGTGLFMSFSTLPLVLIGGLFILLMWWDSARDWRHLLIRGVLFGLGVVVPWGIVWAIYGLSPIAVYRNGLAAHDLLLQMRSYGWWLIYNPWDVLLFAGIPIAFHALRALWRLGGRLRHREPVSAAHWLALALAVSLIALFLAGSVRGETARILLYVMPLVAIIAAADAAHDVRPAGYGGVLTGLLLVQTVVFQATLGVYH